MVDGALTDITLPSPHTIDLGAPLPGDRRFSCLPECGLCCSYRVVINAGDRARLQTGGANQSHIGFVEKTPTGAVLRRSRDFCTFLNGSQQCVVYPHRPDHCRSFPFLWTNFAQEQLDVDFSCPGLGLGETLPTEQQQPPGENEGARQTRLEAIARMHEALRVQQRFASHTVLMALGEWCLGTLLGLWTADSMNCGASLHLLQSQPMIMNAETESDLAGLKQALHLERLSQAELLSNHAWMTRQFSRPQWNTTFDSEMAVGIYRHWIEARTFYTSARTGRSTRIPLGERHCPPWQPEALAVRAAYLKRWMKRQLALRLATISALASVPPRGHLAICFLDFILEIDWRLVVLARALSLARGKQSIDHGIALEAVRGSDGPLRAWCESTQLTMSP